MADTTSLNSGKKSGVNERIVDLFNENVGYDILHVLECMVYVNEIYFSHVISTIEENTKGSEAMQDGALLNCIKNIHKPDITNIPPRQEYSSTDYQYCFSAAKSKGGVKPKVFKMAVSEMITCVCWYWFLIWLWMCQII